MRIEDTLRCDGCGVEVLWAPVKVNQLEYCCRDCADGFECNCGSRMEEDGYTRSVRGATSLDIDSAMLASD